MIQFVAAAFEMTVVVLLQLALSIILLVALRGGLQAPSLSLSMFVSLS